MSLYIGLMSGTSLDGIDAVLLDIDARPSLQPALRVRAHRHAPFDATLRVELLALNSAGADELHRAALAANALALASAQLVGELLRTAGIAAAQVRAIGAHGQTVRHRPGAFDGIGYTVQLNNGALLAERSGIDVVCDFRSRDVAAGGQGAPLVPAFHAALFGDATQPAIVLNLGGIANLSLLDAALPSAGNVADGAVRGFDTGPASALLDGWAARHLGQPYDDGGRWAASGTVLPQLLQQLLAEPFFAAAPPKSSGRDLFNLQWLDSKLRGDEAPQDVQATLLELSARSIAAALQAHAQPLLAHGAAMWVCGGGARNTALMQRLGALLPQLRIATSEARGIGVSEVEAAAFAWLAHRFCERLPGNAPAATGARGARVLGALYPA